MHRGFVLVVAAAGLGVAIARSGSAEPVLDPARSVDPGFSAPAPAWPGDPGFAVVVPGLPDPGFSRVPPVAPAWIAAAASPTSLPATPP